MPCSRHPPGDCDPAFDPNGIAIEFSADVAGVDPRRQPRLIDSHPSPIALEGPDPQPGRWPAPEPPPPLAERTAYPGEGEQLLTKPNAWRGSRAFVQPALAASGLGPPALPPPGFGDSIPVNPGSPVPLEQRQSRASVRRSLPYFSCAINRNVNGSRWPLKNFSSTCS